VENPLGGLVPEADDAGVSGRIEEGVVLQVETDIDDSHQRAGAVMRLGKSGSEMHRLGLDAGSGDVEVVLMHAMGDLYAVDAGEA